MTERPAITAALQQYDRRRRAVQALRAALFGFAVVGLWVFTAVLWDRWLRLPAAARVVMAGVTLLLFAGTLFRIGRALWGGQFDVIGSAKSVEAADAAWQERLVTVVSQAALPADRRASTRLNAALADAVADELKDRLPVRCVRLMPSRGLLLLLVAVAAMWLTLVLIPWSGATRLLHRHVLPWADVRPVTTLQIELSPTSAVIPQGESLTVEAQVTGGRVPVILEVGPTLKSLRPVAMLPTYGDRFIATLLSQQADFVYRVSAGDAVTRPVQVRVARRPGVTGQEIDLQLPDGRSIPGVTATDTGLRMPAGTTVQLRFHVTEPLKSAALRSGKMLINARPGTDSRTWSAQFTAIADATWSIDLLGENNMTANSAATLVIHVDR
ncbi:MAG: hypothetical protein JWM57_4289 [Phycisphaerales bacterium]|nr:hypothetical protein [Phycisphaerales bacterium]